MAMMPKIVNKIGQTDPTILQGKVEKGVTHKILKGYTSKNTK